MRSDKNTKTEKVFYSSKSKIGSIKRRRVSVGKKRISSGSPVKGAENRLKQFRQASILAVAVTGFLLMLLSPSDAGYSQEVLSNGNSLEASDTADSYMVNDSLTEAGQKEETPLSGKEATDEAIGALQNLWNSFVYNLPKILIALSTLFLAWLITKLIKFILKRLTKRWSTSEAITTIIIIVVWLFAIGVAFSVVAGDIRALVGSFGLIGLALSWSLQTPIESFTGWILNSFQRYYKVGDRIRVGDVFGDVYSIDFLTTTVWEIGSPHQPGFVNAEQPTGRLVTFPNNEILAGTVVNLTGDFSYVWDELAVSIANESDIRLAMKVLEGIASNLLGEYMVIPAQEYSKILNRKGLVNEISEKPQIYISSNDWGTDVIIRYLVGARERRKWKTELQLRVSEELSKPEYKNKVVTVYPRQQIQFVNENGQATSVTTKSPEF